MIADKTRQAVSILWWMSSLLPGGCKGKARFVKDIFIFIYLHFHHRTHMKLIVVFFCLLVSCNASRPVGLGQVTGRWELTDFAPYPAALAEGIARPWLELKEDSSLTGFSGCNQLMGKFWVKGDQFQVVEPLNMTRKACPGYNEFLFIDALKKVVRFNFREKELRLMMENGLVMEFTRMPKQ